MSTVKPINNKGLLVRDENKYIVPDGDKNKLMFQINTIEKTMRKGLKDIRRFEPVVAKTSKRYRRVMEEMELKRKILKSFENKRDSLILELQQIA